MEYLLDNEKPTPPYQKADCPPPKTSYPCYPLDGQPYGVSAKMANSHSPYD
ncbi:Uncharacterised protein [Moraxella lacunata]|uniref:Uncharacterized protein n=1 Tax=Moraxella lacunata TaxID=477 RepID=A0A378T409_MORLA|nr:hypothetical protein [Moraxella lacunata]STZ55542.1 Uncharacterised protein [Moraxella lacunata]